ncbi:hypothetical protein SAMN05216436_103150 [bacterium A37T11]|nr:hypothetical protein SAMN05216436_103150 [bacterium A37T11]
MIISGYCRTLPEIAGTWLTLAAASFYKLTMEYLT